MSCRPPILLTVALLTLMTTGLEEAWAQEEEIIIILEEGEEEDSTPIVPSFEQRVLFRGALTNEAALDLAFEGEDERIFRSFHRLFLGAEVEVSESIRAMISGRTTWWMWAKKDGVERYEFEPELRDTYLHWDAPAVVNGTIGLQTWSWGASEFFPTADVLNPRDLRTGPSSGLETPKIPSFGLTLGRSLGDSVHLEVAWLPFYEEDRRSVMATDYGLMGPGSEGDASMLPPGFDELLGGLNPSIVDDVDPLLLGLNRPDEDLLNSTVGTRLTGAFGALDAGLTYVFGWDRTPRLLLDPCLPTVGALLGGDIAPEDLDTAALAGLLLGSGEPITSPDGTCTPEVLLESMFAGELDLLGLLQTRTVRQHTIGGDLVFPVGDLMARLESSWSPQRVFYGTDLSSIRKPFISTTLGFTYAYETTLTVSAEVNHGHILDLDEGQELFLMAQDQIQTGMVIIGRFMEYDALELQLAGLYGVTLEDWVVMPSVGYRFVDGYLLQLGARLLGGEDNSPGSLYDANDEAYILSQWNF